MKKPVALVLGGTIVHVPLIEKLKQRGYWVVLIDYLDNPPAKQKCDDHLQVSTLDRDDVLQAAKRLDASLVINLCLDQPIGIAVSISEELNLPHPYGQMNIKAVTDKAVMKQRMLDCKIPTSKFLAIERKYKKDLFRLKFPVIIKPVDSTGSQGIVIANEYKEVMEGVGIASNKSLSGRVLVEEYVDGIELNVHCIITQSKSQILLIAKKKMVEYGNRFSKIFIGSEAPFELDHNEKVELNLLINDVVKCFEIKNSPLLMQLFLKEGKFTVIEIAARIGGGVGQRLISTMTGVDIVDMAVRQYHKEIIHTPNFIYNDFVVGTIILYANPGVFKEISGINTNEESAYIHESFSFKKPGYKIPEGISSKNRIGALIIRANNRKELAERKREVLECVEIIGSKGEKLLNRKLYQ